MSVYFKIYVPIKKISKALILTEAFENGFKSGTFKNKHSCENAPFLVRIGEKGAFSSPFTFVLVLAIGKNI